MQVFGNYELATYDIFSSVNQSQFAGVVAGFPIVQVVGGGPHPVPHIRGRALSHRPVDGVLRPSLADAASDSIRAVRLDT